MSITGNVAGIGQGALSTLAGLRNNNYGAALSGAGRIASNLGGLSPDYSGALGQIGSTLGEAGNAAGILGGVQRGGVAGYGGALANAGQLYGKVTGNTALNGDLGALNNVLGIYNGIKQGGVAGYGGAAANGMRLAGSAFGNAGLSAAGGYIAAPLAVYNAVNNWKPGATGSDALNGAEAGAAIGSIVPGVGTVIGGLVGGAAGALSSAFGSKDPTAEAWRGWYGGGASQDPSKVSPTGLLNVEGGLWRAGDPNFSAIQMTGGKGTNANQFNVDLAGQIDSALKSGKITANTSPDKVYSDVVAPWLQSSKGGWNTNQAAQYGESNLMRDLTYNYMNGKPMTWGDANGGAPTLPYQSLKQYEASLTPAAGAGPAVGVPPAAVAGALGQAAPALSGGSGYRTQNAAPASLPMGTPANYSDYYKYGQGPEANWFNNNQAVGKARGGYTFSTGGVGPLSQSANYVGNVTGTSGRADDIDAKLANHEYVIDAETTSLLGDGSPEAGAKKLDAMRVNIRKHKGQALARGKFTPKARTPEQYMGARS